ncbi:MAG: 4-hydroxy-tetrahydrodipicolinate synthase [Bacillales bacterium]|jgi:4-hydroxy-tetrahydrodipicolinate synthase|nr:4-hydroxy-tetrahydrodipicolinate synthase [Bacillales bacterium]
MARFGRISTAMVTPFNPDGKIDFELTTALIEYLIENGSDSLVVSGTTGESPTLSKEEKLELFTHVVKVVRNRVPIIAGTGSNNTADTIELSVKAAKLGMDALLLVAPYYNKPSQEGLFQHFKAIAESVSIPVMIYNVPGRTVSNISPETVIRLSKISNIVAVKEASGDLSAMTEIISGTPDDFELYCGDDGLTLPSLAIGAVGVVSVASHIIGTDMQEMISLFYKHQLDHAAKLHQKLLPIMKGLFAAPSPAPVKAALNHKGIQVGSVRLPLVTLTEIEKANLYRLL